MKPLLTALVLFVCVGFIKAQKPTTVPTKFYPAQVWKDFTNLPINAHGGGVLYHKGMYYWYGTHKIDGLSEKTHADGGIHCYASKDLFTWSDMGLVLTLIYNDTTQDLARECNFDRPKVVYNTTTKKFVAFFKLYLKGQGVTTGFVGVATATSPVGPFIYQHKFLGGDSPFGSGDFAIFQEDNGNLYHLTVRKPDRAFVCGKMSDDYLLPSSEYFVCEGITPKTEAPAIIKRNGVYHLLGSESSGWLPNEARYFTSKSLKGPWVSHGNPCEGVNPENSLGKEKTFGSQSTYIMPVFGKKDAYIAMFDINKPENPYDSRHIWLPITFINDKFKIIWQSSWDLSVYDKK